MEALRVLVDGRWRGPHGIGRFFEEVVKRLPPSWAIIDDIGGKPLEAVDPLRVSLALRRWKPDVYFSPGISPPLWSGVPFVLTVHDLIPLRVPEERTAGKLIFYQSILRPAVRRAHRVLTVSEFSKREIIEWAGLAEESVVVVPNGVSSEFRPEGSRLDLGFPYILYVGNHKPHKNVRRLIEAFARLRGYNDLKLCLTGLPNRSLAQRIDELGVGQRVVFLGMVREESLPALYRGASVFVCPSLYEGFGLPCLEAMASGVPVVASKVTALPEVTGDAAVLVDPYDPDSIAAGLQVVLDNRELRAQLRANGLRRARAFTWQHTANGVAEVLRAAVE